MPLHHLISHVLTLRDTVQKVSMVYVPTIGFSPILSGINYCCT